MKTRPIFRTTQACMAEDHARCRSKRSPSGARGCECWCHDDHYVPLNMEARAHAIREEHQRKQAELSPPKRTRDHCAHNHDLSPESGNLGPNGACRACKREASDRCRAKAASK